MITSCDTKISLKPKKLIILQFKTIEALLKKHHRVITLSKEEVKNFCGNCIEVKDKENNKILLMSSRAYSNFSKKNLLELSSYYPKILHTNLQYADIYETGTNMLNIPTFFFGLG